MATANAPRGVCRPKVVATGDDKSFPGATENQHNRETLQRILALNDEGQKHCLFPAALGVWADSDPIGALEWYHDEAQDSLEAAGYLPNPDFHHKCFRALVKKDTGSAASSLPAITLPANRIQALAAMLSGAAECNTLPELLEALHASELRPSEMALVCKAVGDLEGYERWGALVADPIEKNLIGSAIVPGPGV